VHIEIFGANIQQNLVCCADKIKTGSNSLDVNYFATLSFIGLNWRGTLALAS